MPRWYIGSTSIKKIEEGYHGSVHSKKFKNTWQQELKNHPELFRTEIIKSFGSRKEALQNEYELQIACNVVKSDDYINLSFAKENGYFGLDVSGELNPMYGKTHTQQVRDKIRNVNTGAKRSVETKNKMSEHRKGKKKTEIHKKRISEAHKGIRAGVILSEEHKLKISAALKGKGISDEAYSKRLNKIWITNDIESKKISKNEEIPDGWRVGRKYFKRERRINVFG